MQNSTSDIAIPVIFYSRYQPTNVPRLPFIGFAPDFDNEVAEHHSCQSHELPGLLCNQNEIKSVTQLLGGRCFYRDHATKANFMIAASEARILHLATHACVDLETESRNQIFFADDYLSSPQLKNLKLNADLVVLSACNTGSGKMLRGEGLMSLSRSFMIAGCPSTLMSLWSVDDCSTSELMISFYSSLKSGSSKSEALKRAKLSYLSTAGKAKAHPYYWAGFVLNGNHAPLYKPWVHWAQYTCGFFVGLLALGYWQMRPKLGE